MLECKLQNASILKKLLDAVKDLVINVNFDCNDTGISLQAMDSAHIALISLLLRETGFEHYRCDRNINLGLSLPSLQKIMKSCGNDDNLSLAAMENADELSLTFENKKTDRVCEFELKLMDVDAEHLAIPECDYEVTFQMSSSEFKTIVTNLSSMSETITISVTKEGIQFSCIGDIGSGSITVKPSEDSIDEESEEHTTISLNSPVSVLLSAKYLCDFAKATPLSKSVLFGISNDLPVLVEYKVNEVGHLRYYVAPKVNDEE